MRGLGAAWQRFGALCATLVLALSLAAAPAVEAAKHGPGAVAAEAEHRAYHAAHGHQHDLPQQHHDAGDHDHVAAALLLAPGAEHRPPPERSLRPGSLSADGTIHDGPRRPPRLLLI